MLVNKSSDQGDSCGSLAKTACGGFVSSEPFLSKLHRVAIFVRVVLEIQLMSGCLPHAVSPSAVACRPWMMEEVMDDGRVGEQFGAGACDG